jgi:hypothetical protein
MNQVYEQYSQDPDETFKMYVDRLMKVPPKFSGTFASAPQQSSETPSANKGLLTGLFPEYADKMGGGGGGVGDNGMPPVNSDSAPNSFNPRGNFASADDVVRADSLARGLANSGKGLSKLGSAILGPYGMLLGFLPGLTQSSANSAWDSFNAGQDSDAAARAEAASLGGVGTFSDSKGNIGTISNQALIDDYDRRTFGVTGAELSGGGVADGSPVGADAPGTDYSGYSAADLGL